MNRYAAAVRSSRLVQRTGRIVRLSGLLIESVGPDCAVGDVCELFSRRNAARVKAEVVALQQGRVMLMPYGELHGIGLDADAVATGASSTLRIGRGLLGRVVDAFGQPFDGRPPTTPASSARSRRSRSTLRRPRIDGCSKPAYEPSTPCLTLGQGQRVGIFAGSGVGKSTLLGMIARHMPASQRDRADRRARARSARVHRKNLGAEGPGALGGGGGHVRPAGRWRARARPTRPRRSPNISATRAAT